MLIGLLGAAAITRVVASLLFNVSPTDSEGTRMRRTSAVLMLFFGGITGCRGSEAQVPYDGLVAVGQRPAQTAPVLAAQTEAAEPLAAEPNVPWAIALLSDAPERPPKRSGKVTILAAKPEPRPTPGAIAHEADIHIALESDEADEKSAAAKPAAPKSCSGVVNRRS